MGEARVDIAIVGCGIVGLSCAFHLMRRGLRCVLIDPGGPGAETSFGNAGSISIGNVMPQATPGIVAKGIRMLCDPRAPLKFDLGAFPRYAGWLRDFVAASRIERVLPIVDALHAINTASRAAWLELARDIGAGSLVEASGYLHVYSDESTYVRGAWERGLMRERGVLFETLDRTELAGLEPGLGPDFARGVFQPESLALRDPGAFCSQLHRVLIARGAVALSATVQRLQSASDSVTLTTDRGDVQAARVVIAAGIWSRALLQGIGIQLPLVAARGYHRMYPSQAGVVRRPTLWAERYMVVSPMQHGIRMTSIKQLTSVGRRPRFELIRRRDVDARRLFPALSTAGASEWSGLRPCTPDSLPILDAVDDRIFIAAGHGHLGITQGPISGELIAQSVVGEAQSLPLAPYRLDRFARPG